MTYAELKDMLKEFTDAQLEQTVTIYVSGLDEYYPLVGDYPLCESDESCDVLDPGHRYLVI
jgi:hypothetical protein